MAQYLLFHLYGPMSSWGEIAVGEVRSSQSRPTRSAIMGMFSGALGFDRRSDEKHIALDASLGFAVREDAPGQIMTDYHTIQMPKHSHSTAHATRREELYTDSTFTNSKKIVTLLSSREYVCDGAWTVCVWSKEVSGFGKTSLLRLFQALKCPYYVPYLGRKSCPLGYPLIPSLTEADTVASAFYKVQPPPFIKKLPNSGKQNVWWDAEDDIGISANHQMRRRDRLVSRRRWQFSERLENQGVLNQPLKHKGE